MIVNISAQGHMCKSPTLNLLSHCTFFKKDLSRTGDMAQWIKHFPASQVGIPRSHMKARQVR